MTGKKFGLGILVIALVFGMMVAGCAGGTKTRITGDGIKTITAADGTVTVIDLKTDGKGGTIFVQNTSNSIYWVVYPVSSNYGSSTRLRTASARYPGQAGVYTIVEEDGEYQIFFRAKIGEERAPSIQLIGTDGKTITGAETPIPPFWWRKSVYVSNDETFTITIP